MNEVSKEEQGRLHVTYFITPHGFGHAARAAAVMSAMQEICNVYFTIYTAVPEWFFRESVQRDFDYYHLETDIGLVQESPLVEDLEATADRLDAFLPFNPKLVHDLAGQQNLRKCQLILCDIAPLGIAVAKEAGIPSVLMENFTWDWIYQGYAKKYPRLVPHVRYLRQVFTNTDYLIQTEPVCRPGACDLTTPPVSRKVRMGVESVCKHLQPGDKPMILVTMGGIAGAGFDLDHLYKADKYIFLLPGEADTLITEKNVRMFPFQSGLYHPDLIHASAAVIGKVGYSTVAEVYQAGLPYGYIPRQDFRESVRLTRFIQETMIGMEISEKLLAGGEWLRKIPDLIAMKHQSNERNNGASVIAEFLLPLLSTGYKGRV